MNDTVTLLTRRADLAPASANCDDRTVEVIWSTGAPVRRRDMAGQYIERLSLAPEAVDLSRLQGASVLDAHRQSAVRDVLGSVQSAAVDGQRGTALIRFSSRPEVEPLWQDVLSGILRHVSVGYSVEEWAEATENGARVLTAVRWTPHEISLVPTPADPGAHIRMETRMTDTTITQALPEAQTRATINTEIRSIARIAGLDQSWIDGQIDVGSDADTARRAAFEALATRSAPTIRTEQVRVEMGDSQDDPALRARQMAEFGWTVPVLVAADGELIAGHGRILAAAHLGMTEAPVIVLGHLTEAQRRAYRIADNKLTELGGWDEALLLQELQALLAEDFDLGLIGISEDELDALLADADDRPTISDDAADAIPAPPAEPITRPGDIWALGKHRLCCGDATDPTAVARLMQGEQATLMFTSPPYAQQRDYGAAKEKVGDWDALMQGVFAAVPVTADAQLLVNLGLVHRDSEWQPYWEGWVEWMRKSGWRRFGWYVWDQGPGLPGDWNGRLAPSHEFIFHFNRAPRKPHKTVPSKHAGETLGGGGLRGADGTVHAKTGTGNAIQSHRIPDSVFRIMRHKAGLGAAGSHPAVFPVALVEAVLTAFSDPGDPIYEPFCGSGTQIVAAERAGRRCFAMELDPVYCDVAVRRWEMTTGRKAMIPAH